MSFQNPVFIPGPTNMPEAIRQACYMPTIDHRSNTRCGGDGCCAHQNLISTQQPKKEKNYEY